MTTADRVRDWFRGNENKPTTALDVARAMAIGRRSVTGALARRPEWFEVTGALENGLCRNPAFLYRLSPLGLTAEAPPEPPRRVRPLDGTRGCLGRCGVLTANGGGYCTTCLNAKGRA